MRRRSVLLILIALTACEMRLDLSACSPPRAQGTLRPDEPSGKPATRASRPAAPAQAAPAAPVGPAPEPLPAPVRATRRRAGVADAGIAALPAQDAAVAALTVDAGIASRDAASERAAASADAGAKSAPSEAEAKARAQAAQEAELRRLHTAANELYGIGQQSTGYGSGRGSTGLGIGQQSTGFGSGRGATGVGIGERSTGIGIGQGSTGFGLKPPPPAPAPEQ